tara:strand:- start:41 stop:619 length:579 start_codon:yes stop_codon:yes gene_type:complete
MQTKPDYYYIPTAIDRDVVEVIQKQCDKLQLIKSVTLDKELNSSEYELLKYRNSKNSWIHTDNWISGMMKHFVEVANNNVYNYDINQWADKIQYTVYDEKNSHYGWHTDSSKSSFHENYVRKLSISLLLSDSDDYEGGQLQIMLPSNTKMVSFKPPIGTAIIFPSTYRHRVRPVKSGKRVSLVGWYGGPDFR